MARLLRLAGGGRTGARMGARGGHGPVRFERSEMNLLLALYSRQVSSGQWRDYALDHLEGMAVFSVYRKSQEGPIYAITKFRPGARRQGDYMVSAGWRTIRQGRSLQEVLEPFDRRLEVIAP